MAIAAKRLKSCELSEPNLTALRDATVLLTRYFFDAVNELSKGVPNEDTWTSEYLPSKYRASYDEAFARQFLTGFLAMSAKLWDGGAFRPACVGEQLAFHALLDFAQATLEARGTEADFGLLWDLAYDDLGAKTLVRVVQRDRSAARVPRMVPSLQRRGRGSSVDSVPGSCPDTSLVTEE
ncbi:MAG TPA: hypothetical protein VKZ50_09290 [bacterium]|nr:hypothetical protein [bacterium]